MRTRTKRLTAALLAGCMACSIAGVSASAVTGVAKIGSTSYMTLNAALNAVKTGETITLQSNIDNSKEAYYPGVGKGSAYFTSDSAAKEFTIDLKGYTISAGTESEAGLLIVADKNAGDLSVTLKNGTISASGENVLGIEIQDYEASTPTTVTLDDMTIKADGEAGIDCLSSNLVVKSATVTGVSDAIYAEDSTIQVDAAIFTATGEDTNADGAIAAYTNASATEWNLDLSAVSISDAMVIRPSDWDVNPTSSLYILNFKDISADEYYYESVLWAAENGVTSGTSPSTFSPGSTCTRAQVVQFLYNAYGNPTPADTESPFTDVKPGEWYYDAVQWAVQEGITAGTSETTFSPNMGCTRGQVAVLLWNAAGRPEPGADAPTFSDIKSTDYFYDAVRWAAQEGITAGTGDNKFSPNTICTRAQTVTLLYHYMGNQEQ